MGWTDTFLKGIGVPEEHAAALLAAEAQLAPFAGEMRALERSYCETPPDDVTAYEQRLAAVAEAAGVHPHTVRYLFYVHAAAWLLERFRADGVPEAIYWETMRDMRYKLYECLDLYDVPGAATVNWYTRFFRMKLLAFGRLQFEQRAFPIERYEKNGHVVRRGDTVLALHIPSAGPLTQDLCQDAYARAHAYFRPLFPNGPTVFTCDSWLLYPEHVNFLPEGNIRRFMADFDILGGRDDPSFSDGWRVFGKAAENPPERLPTDTGLRRAYAERLRAGLPVGTGFGVMLYGDEPGKESRLHACKGTI